MDVLLEIEKDGEEIRVIGVPISSEALTIREVLAPTALAAEIELEELLLDLGVGETQFDISARVGDVLHHGNRWRHRRVCIDLHFEAEEKKHHFPARAMWSRVHRWSCTHFHVAPDLCANLELREGSPKGPALNENLPIGHFKGCKIVWLVKPGPEPYGRK